jgi:hypothetical protein
LLQWGQRLAGVRDGQGCWIFCSSRSSSSILVAPLRVLLLAVHLTLLLLVLLFTHVVCGSGNEGFTASHAQKGGARQRTHAARALISLCAPAAVC